MNEIESILSVIFIFFSGWFMGLIVGKYESSFNKGFHYIQDKIEKWTD